MAQNRLKLLLVVVASSCVPRAPAHVADVLHIEPVEQTFLVKGNGDSQLATYESLVGANATLVLAQVKPDVPLAAMNGELTAKGALILMARLSPYDSSKYVVEGRGQLGVYHQKQLLISVDVEVGGPEAHAIDGLSKKTIVLPVRQWASLNPVLLLGAAKRKDDGCMLSVKGDQRLEQISCLAEGVGSPFVSDYFVRIHLVEIQPGEVFAVDRSRGHELFRETSNGLDVFGCVTFDPALAFNILDLSGRNLVKTMPATSATPLAMAKRDALEVPVRCGSIPAGGSSTPSAQP